MRAEWARRFSLEALRSIMRLPFTLPRQIMAQPQKTVLLPENVLLKFQKI